MALKRTQLIGAPGLQASESSSVQSLKSRLNLDAGQYFQEAAQISSELGAGAGFEEGIQLDEEGKAIAPSLKAGITAFQQQFNKSALDAYSASVKADVRTDLDRIYVENADNSEAYTSKVEAYSEGLQKELHPEIAEEIMFSISKTRNDTGLRVAAADLAKKRSEAISAHDENINSAVDFAKRESLNGNQNKALEYAEQAFEEIERKVENGYLEIDDALAQKHGIKKSVMETAIQKDLRDIYKLEGESAAFEEISALQAEVPEDFTVEEWDTFTGALVADITQQVTIQKKVRTAEEIQQDAKLSNLMIQAKTGEGDAGELTMQFEAMFKDPTSNISEKKRTSFYVSLMNSQKEQRKQAESFSDVSKRLGGDQSVILDKGSVDKFYQDIYANIPELDNVTKAYFVEQTRMVPSAMKNELRQFIMSDDIELVLQASDLADRIEETPGVMDNVFSPTEKAFANQVKMLSSNMEPERAIKTAKELTDPNNRDRVAAREQEIKKGKFHKEDSEYISDNFESGFLGKIGRAIVGLEPVTLSPVNKDRILNEFRSTRDAIYMAGYSDKDDTDQKALKEISRNYGEFDFGGRNYFMKYPMDLYYQSQEGTSYIAGQAVMEASQLMGEDVTADQIYFDWDDTTAREASSGEPSYLMMVIDNGVPVYLGQRWRPDPSQVNARVAMEREEAFVEERAAGVRRSKAQEEMAKAREGMSPFSAGL